jgi:hypothetical protein
MHPLLGFCLKIITQQIMNKFVCVEKNQRFLLNYGALSPDKFFPARQVTDIILNEYSRNTENALVEWLGKETTSYFTKSKNTWFLWF